MDLTRPPRRANPGLDSRWYWESQAVQYDRPDIVPVTGIVHWTVPKDEAPVRIECLLAYGHSDDAALTTLIGILNYYPEGSPIGEQPHDYLVLVRPAMRRHGIGSALVGEALRRWPDIDLMNQAYSDSGWALSQTIIPYLDRKD